MSENPYEPPGSRLEKPGARPARPVRGVIAGLVVDIAGTVLGTNVLGIGYGIVLALQGYNEDQIAAVVENLDVFSGFGLLTTAVGFYMSYLGGYWCLRVARTTDLRPGYVLAGLIAALGLSLSLLAGNFWIGLLLTVIGFCATMLGALRGRRRGLLA